MLLKEDEIEEKWFEDADILHFCSVSLGEFPMKYAHKKAIEYAKKKLKYRFCNSVKFAF